MTNPYQSTEATLNTEHRSDKKIWQSKPLSIGLTILSIFPYIGLYAVVPQFKEMFIAFGADLPTLTQLYIYGYPYSGVIFVTALIICLIHVLNKSLNEKKLKLAFRLIVTHCIFSFVLFVASGIAMYLPIFKLGEVV